MATTGYMCCPTCGGSLRQYKLKYEQLLDAGFSEGLALDALLIPSACCKPHVSRDANLGDRFYDYHSLTTKSLGSNPLDESKTAETFVPDKTQIASKSSEVKRSEQSQTAKTTQSAHVSMDLTDDSSPC